MPVHDAMAAGDAAAMTWDEVVALARDWPEVVLGTSYGSPALKVRRHLLVRLRPEEDSLVLLDVGPEERDMRIAAVPDVFFVTAHYAPYDIVLARLAGLDAQMLTPLLARRWHARATRRARAQPGAPGSEWP